MNQIDINCDMGESFGHFRVGNDEAIFPHITSCNIACGYHGGDPLTIDQTIRGALSHDLQIGAHPGFPDLAGFGRRNMQIRKNELVALIKYQIASVKGMTEGLGGRMTYVKPHGALYNLAADDQDLALAILEAIREIDPGLALMGMAGSAMEAAAVAEGVQFVAEAFADRRYTDTRRLVSRSKENAVISDPADAVAQVVQIVNEQQVTSESGKAVSVRAQSVCIHGDNPSAIAILSELADALKEHNILVQRFSVS